MHVLPEDVLLGGLLLVAPILVEELFDLFNPKPYQNHTP